MDLALGHVAALKYIDKPSAESVSTTLDASTGFGDYSVFNLGTDLLKLFLKIYFILSTIDKMFDDDDTNEL